MTNPNSRKRAFTFVEMIVVIMIVLLLISMSIIHFRNTRHAAASMTTAFASHMEARKASDAIKEALLDGTEVVKPPDGSSLPYLVVRDAVNRLKILFLEKVSDKPDSLYRMVLYTDDYSGTHKSDNRRILFENVKEAWFTALSPGIVIVQFSLLDTSKKELPVLVEASLKNLASIPNE